MRITRQRLAGTGLAIAAITILALAVLAMVELDREARLHRDLLARRHARDSLEALRVQLVDLAHAARIATLADDAGARQEIARRSVEIDAELGYLATHPSRDPGSGTFDELAQAARALVVNARSAAPGSGGQETRRVAAEASLAVARALQEQEARINERTVAQIRVGETLRRYVAWLVAGSSLVLVGLFGFYRWAHRRERESRRRIEHLAHHDVVTGLPNRALLADRLALEVARSRRESAPFALLMFDLDGFKAVNDTRGHAAGDALLAAVACRARSSLRASDTVGRLGGDEFMAVLPATDVQGAVEVAEKLRAALAGPYEVEGSPCTVGASIGVALFPAHADDPEALQRVADAALYAAKAGGRNRVEVAAKRAAVAGLAEAISA